MTLLSLSAFASLYLNFTFLVIEKRKKYFARISYSEILSRKLILCDSQQFVFINRLPNFPDDFKYTIHENRIIQKKINKFAFIRFSESLIVSQIKITDLSFLIQKKPFNALLSVILNISLK